MGEKTTLCNDGGENCTTPCPERQWSVLMGEKRALCPNRRKTHCVVGVPDLVLLCRPFERREREMEPLLVLKMVVSQL